MASVMNANELQLMGEQLRLYRCERKDRQIDMAARLGIGLSTLKAMEAGSPGVAIGHWMKAFSLMGVSKKLMTAVGSWSEKSLVEQFRQQELKPKGVLRVRKSSRV